MTEIRSGVLADLPALTALYNYYVENSIITFDVTPFTPAEREPWFSQFDRQGRYLLFVAERDGAIIGYATSTRHRAKPAYDTSVEVTVYVSTNHAREGIGAMLYKQLFSELESEDVHAAFAGVAQPNPASVAFHKAFGFTEIGVFHEIGRKFGRFHDVLWLEKHL